MTENDPRHGTTAGHIAHRLAGEQACAPCVAAKTRYEKERLYRGGVMVPALGTRRRIRALKAMGHSGAEIAAQMGVTYQAVHKIEHGTAEKMFAATAEKVAAAYEAMCMTIPDGYHRTRIRNQSAARGYALPLMWDDIDRDPEPAAYCDLPRDLLAEWDHLRRSGESIEQAAKQLGVTVGAIERALERAKGRAA